MGSLAAVGAAIKAARAALQTAISNAQAASAQAAAISTAATDATEKMSAAQTNAQNYADTTKADAIAAAATDATTKMSAAIDAAKVKVVDSLPSLPDAAYPPETIIWNNADTWLYGTDGDAWYPITPDASLLVGQITAGQIAAGAIGADQIAAGAVEAKSLVVADWTNLCYNPDFKDEMNCWQPEGPCPSRHKVAMLVVR